MTLVIVIIGMVVLVAGGGRGSNRWSQNPRAPTARGISVAMRSISAV
jgi:hypothetical protein